MASAQEAPVLSSHLPIACQGCYLPYGDFVATYYKRSEGLVKLLITHDLLPEKKVCEKCGEECCVDMNKKTFQCDRTRGENQEQCNFSQSIFKGTWLEKNNVGFEISLRFVKLFLQDFYTEKVAKNELELADETIRELMSSTIDVLVSWSVDQENKIGGLGEIVEIGESKFGRRKYSAGRVVEGQWVLGGFCRNNRSCFVVPVENRNRDTLFGIIKDRILPGTTVISECWKVYECLDSDSFQQLNHSYDFVDPDSSQESNIKQQWRKLKRRVSISRLKRHFVGDLANAVFRIQYPEVEKRFHVFIKQAAKIHPPPSP